MKKLKKFNELFDTEELRDEPEHEISKITGDYSYLVDPTVPMMKFKDDNIVNFIRKVSYLRFPFFNAFLAATEQDSGELKFKDFSVGTKFIEEDNTYNLMAFSKEHLLAIGLKIVANNNYDVYIYSDNLNDEEYFKDFEKKGVTANEFCEIIQEAYLPELESIGFSELTYFNYDDYLSINN